MITLPDARSVRVPELVGDGCVWVNSKPLTLEQLRGRLVILDFWTFCCINCIQALPTLKLIEQRFPTEVVVIGVHSPKFSAEESVGKVRLAVERYGIEHPVIHDPKRVLLSKFVVNAWPSFVFVSPEGLEIGRMSGEPDRNQLLPAIERVLSEWRAEGLVRPATLGVMPTPPQENRLSFPAKIRPADGGFVLADSGHNQIVLLDGRGSELARIGSGEAGLRDGSPSRAQFRKPQGVAVSRDSIFVADTENHAIRTIDRATGETVTLIGSGERGSKLDDRPRLQWALASPWDVALMGDLLVFANAGTHQLGGFDLKSKTVSRLAGSGAEDIIDGAAARAALAQPSGVAICESSGDVYFADSETSAIRKLSVRDGMISTLIGSGLFSFGHVNGKWSRARLQHPLDLCIGSDVIAVADSYNDTVRLISISNGDIRDFDEGDFSCVDDVCIPLSEPAGICPAGVNKFLVVDTNNHRVVCYDGTLRRISTWLS